MSLVAWPCQLVQTVRPAVRKQKLEQSTVTSVKFKPHSFDFLPQQPITQLLYRDILHPSTQIQSCYKSKPGDKVPNTVIVAGSSGKKKEVWS